MIAAVTSLTALGLSLGLILSIAARRLRVEADPLVVQIESMLPGAQCGQCGFPGCRGAAEALARGEASPTLCPPGGRDLAARIAERLGITADLSAMGHGVERLARVREDHCIGCTKCFKVCPTDAIVGAPKQIHAVLTEACIACGNCIEVCPTECLELLPMKPTLGTWRWPKPPVSLPAAA